MQWNQGKFRQNGNCGYVLKPDSMISETQDQSKLQFDPTKLGGNETCDLLLHIQVYIHFSPKTLFLKQDALKF